MYLCRATCHAFSQSRDLCVKNCADAYWPAWMLMVVLLARSRIHSGESGPIALRPKCFRDGRLYAWGCRELFGAELHVSWRRSGDLSPDRVPLSMSRGTVRAHTLLQLREGLLPVDSDVGVRPTQHDSGSQRNLCSPHTNLTHLITAHPEWVSRRSSFIHLR